LKILFCAYDRPGHIATGPNAWVQRLIPDLRKTYNLDVHTLFIYSGKYSECPTLHFFEQNNLPIKTINREERPFVSDQVRSILSILKAESFNVLVANLVIPAFYAARYLKAFNIPVVGVMHSNDDFYRGVIRKFIKGKTENQLTTVVSVSNYINNLAYCETTDILYKVIPCGTPILGKQSNWNGERPLKIIYAGRLVIEAKQILKLAKAFCEASKINNDLVFSIYGDGDQEENVKNIIASCNCEDRVELFEALPPSEIIKKISEHHLFTLMSDYEGMPLSLMEAMACGVVPVCYINEGGIDEIIKHGVNGFIITNRDEDYQTKLKTLSDNPELWKTMSKNAMDTIKNKYSSDITHQQWFELLQSFKDNPTKKIKLPRRIKLEGELLHYGDNRMPDFSTKFKSSMANKWLNFKQSVRPRARLRALFKNEK
jgi:colanic acid/amylovoran biosynthesis glycosyltransferase